MAQHISAHFQESSESTNTTIEDEDVKGTADVVKLP